MGLILKIKYFDIWTDWWWLRKLSCCFFFFSKHPTRHFFILNFRVGEEKVLMNELKKQQRRQFPLFIFPYLDEPLINNKNNYWNHSKLLFEPYTVIRNIMSHSKARSEAYREHFHLSAITNNVRIEMWDYYHSVPTYCWLLFSHWTESIKMKIFVPWNRTDGEGVSLCLSIWWRKTSL